MTHGKRPKRQPAKPVPHTRNKRLNPHVKARDIAIDAQYLRDRSAMLVAAGWPISKWIGFCQALLETGYSVRLYEAKKTVSKYITIWRHELPAVRPVKVRFSNHKPIPYKEAHGDCDFFVGIANSTTTTTAQALAWVRKHFGEIDGQA